MNESKKTPEAIEIADQLELRVIDLDTGETRRYRSSVLDIAADSFAVAIPTDRRVPVALPDGTTVVVSIWKDFADHLFKARVLGKEKGRVPQMILSKPPPETIKRTPRREYFRVDTKVTTRVLLVEDGESVTLPAIMLDLSGGGCRLQTTRHLRADTPLKLDFDLPFPADKDGLDQARPMRQVPGKVRLSFAPAATDSRSRARQSVHMVGVEFDHLDNVVHNALLRYVAFRQREILNQLEEGTAQDRKVSSEEVEEIQEKLSALEQDLREAGQEVPQAAPAPDAATVDAAPDATTSSDAVEEPTAIAEKEPPPGSVDELFAPTPAQEEAPEPVPAGPRILPPGGTPSGKTILLVEDEDPLRKILATALQQEGHRVAAAANGQEALQITLQTPVDLVITDLMMPKMNGWRLLSNLRQRGMELPAIIITGYLNQEGQDVLTSRDISGYLIKPIHLDELAAMVANIFSSPAARTLRILAVDDEEDTRLLVSSCLAKAGFVAETAAGGREALARVESFRPDLILLDIMMPNMDGFEVARRLRSQTATASTPIMLLTVKSSPEYVRKAVAMKINGYIVKPFDPVVLIERIRKTLRLKAPTPPREAGRTCAF